MFAGPNGSGKSTIKSLLRPELMGVYVNPDDIEAAIRRDGTLDLAGYGVSVTTDQVRAALTGSDFLKSAGLAEACAAVGVAGGVIDFGGLAVNSYHASVLSDFLRRKLIEVGVAFSFETVMSHRDKVDLLRDARAAGYRTYLYFVVTRDPAINVRRVAARVVQGGHAVPADKVVERYTRSLGLLSEAVSHTDRAFLFDNSGDEVRYVAEVTGGTDLVVHSAPVPDWLTTFLIDKFKPTPG